MRAVVLEEFNGSLVMNDVPGPTITPMDYDVLGDVVEVGSEIEYLAPGDRVAVGFYVT